MAMPTLVGLGSGVNAVFQSTTSRTWPAGHAANDVAIAFLSGTKGGAPTPSSAGWTEFSWSGAGVIKTNPASNVDQDEVRVYWKRATSGAEAALSLNDASSDGTDFNRCTMIVIRGLPTTGEPLNSYNYSLVNSLTTVVNFPTLAVSSLDCYILYFMLNSFDSATNQYSGSLTNADLANISVLFTPGGSATGDGNGTLVIGAERALPGAVGSGSGYSLSNASTQICVALALGQPGGAPVHFARRRGRR